ncbi:putative oxidoreductase [Zancudomyces culisetae]|uniref:Putative oxidoreductase n=1 Tax=Zancudomyces culisetae TaxID=1213189 RepID=A0A1R1PVT8_ZANCU|nr:putative oxidoreductase [Zancudomyces culisetae]|eukprot:OMH85085.1 putative oxidoreductase [Zancudomyces culisetae]
MSNNSRGMSSGLLVAVVIGTAASIYLYLTGILGIVPALAANALIIASTVVLGREKVNKKPIVWENEVVIITGGNRIKYYEGDVSNYKTLEPIVEKIVKDLGTPTVLFNNAGIMVPKSFLEFTPDQIDKLLAINLSGPIYLTRLVAPLMLKNRKGHIISMGSVASFVTFPHGSTYCASKHGLHGFFEGVRHDLRELPGGSKIKISVIYPSVVNTGLFDGLKTSTSLIANSSPDSVARAFIDIVESQEGHEIFLPRTAKITSFLSAFSRSFRDRVYNLLDAQNSMKEFKGRDLYFSKTAK